MQHGFSFDYYIVHVFIFLYFLYFYSGITYPPRESFNRWLINRKLDDSGSDAFIPSQCPETPPTYLMGELTSIVRLDWVLTGQNLDKCRTLFFRLQECISQAKVVAASDSLTAEDRDKLAGRRVQMERACRTTNQNAEVQLNKTVLVYDPGYKPFTGNGICKYVCLCYKALQFLSRYISHSG